MTRHGRLAAAALASLALHALVIASNGAGPAAGGDAAPLRRGSLRCLSPSRMYPKPRVRAPRHAAPVPFPGPALPRWAPARPEPQPEAAPRKSPRPSLPRRSRATARSRGRIQRRDRARSHAAPRAASPTRWSMAKHGPHRQGGAGVASPRHGAYPDFERRETGGIVELFRPPDAALREPGPVHARGVAAGIVPMTYPPRAKRGGARRASTGARAA